MIRLLKNTLFRLDMNYSDSDNHLLDFTFTVPKDFFLCGHYKVRAEKKEKQGANVVPFQGFPAHT